MDSKKCLHEWQYNSELGKDVCSLCGKVLNYEHRNRTQRLLMQEISWLNELVFMRDRKQYFNDWFRLRFYLFKKYKIKLV